MKFIESAKKKESIFKRGATMMQNEDEKHAFEDSRETMLLFEKYKLIELVRFYLISSCSALTIIDVNLIKYVVSMNTHLIWMKTLIIIMK